MCNRYKLQEPEIAAEVIEQALAIGFRPEGWAKVPRFNIAPQSIVPVIARTGRVVQLKPMIWGIVPVLDDGTRAPRAYTNATAEKAMVWSGFRRSTERRRCLLPADGYYEWKEIAGVKYPHLFALRSGEPFAFAGIWEVADGPEPETVSFLTTKPNALAAAVHNRMPVVLTKETMGRWLGEEPLSAEEYRALTGPAPDGLLVEREVSRFVSSSRHEGPECIGPANPHPPDQLGLF